MLLPVVQETAVPARVGSMMMMSRSRSLMEFAQSACLMILLAAMKKITTPPAMLMERTSHH